MHFQFSEHQGNLVVKFSNVVADYEVTVHIPSFEVLSIYRLHGIDLVVTDLEELPIDDYVQLITKVKEIKQRYEDTLNR